MKVKMVKINANLRRISKLNGVCMTAKMLKEIEEAPKDYVEVDSLIAYMHWINRKYNKDEFTERDTIDDFINLLEGVLKEHSNPDEIEWGDE